MPHTLAGQKLASQGLVALTQSISHEFCNFMQFGGVVPVEPEITLESLTAKRRWHSEKAIEVACEIERREKAETVNELLLDEARQTLAFHRSEIERLTLQIEEMADAATLKAAE